MGSISINWEIPPQLKDEPLTTLPIWIWNYFGVGLLVLWGLQDFSVQWIFSVNAPILILVSIAISAIIYFLTANLYVLVRFLTSKNIENTPYPTSIPFFHARVTTILFIFGFYSKLPFSEVLIVGAIICLLLMLNLKRNIAKNR